MLRLHRATQNATHALAVLLLSLFAMGAQPVAGQDSWSDYHNDRNSAFPSSNTASSPPPAQPAELGQGSPAAPRYQGEQNLPPAHHATPATSPNTSLPPSPQSAVQIEATEIVAVVGDQVILAGDLLGQINQLLEQYVNQMTPQQLAEQREVGIKQLLPRAIEAKLGYLEFLRTVDSEVLPQIRADMYEQFDEKRLPEMIEEAGLTSAAELDAKLRHYGSSLEKQRRAFFEQSVHREMVRRNINLEEEVSHEEMLEYYHAHSEEYDYPARARWEQIVVRFRNYPNKGEAYRALAEMGNEVLRGAPFEVVARRSSEGPAASQGGQFDWTAKGSLASDLLDEALFTLPVNQISQIIEDEKSFHILRVIEREVAGRTPFAEAQVEIAEQIRSDRRQAQIETYLTQLRANTPIWTIYDEEIAQQGEASSPSR